MENQRPSLRRSKNPVVRKVVFAIQVIHLLVGLGFLALALAEFARDPPFFDSVDTHNSSHIATFRNVTGLASESIRRAMDLPILMLFVSYFAVLLWRGGWGTWPFLMTLSILLTLFVFVLINYWASGAFDWRYFSSRGVGVLLQIFCFAVAWATVCVSAMTKSNVFIFKITNKLPKDLWLMNLVVAWNFFATTILLYFVLLVWFSRLYFSWACVRSLEEVLLLCQFTNLVQCYPCREAYHCHNVDRCIEHSNITTTFHCLSPMFMMNVQNAFCIFNYNIGFFTFISVFAYVGGTYFFFRAVLNFTVLCVRVLTVWLITNLKQKTKQNYVFLQSLTMSMSASRPNREQTTTSEEGRELLKDMSSESSDEEDSQHRQIQANGDIDRQPVAAASQD